MIPHATKTQNDLQDDELEFGFERSKHVKWYHHLLLNRPLKVVVVGLLLCIAAPLLIYRFLFFTSLDLPPADGFSIGSCLVARSSRLMCGVGNVTQNECHPQCCYDLHSNFCFHRFPSRFSYVMDRQWCEEVIMNPRIATVPFSSQNSLSRVRLSVDERSKTHLSLTFYDAANLDLRGERLEDKNYDYTVASPELNVIVNSAQGTIFDTLRGPLIASQNIWEITFKLTNESMFGLGELPLKEGTTKVIYNHKGGMSSIPLIFAKSNGSYHGLLFDMMSPTEVTIQSEKLIVVRSITTFGLKFHLFVGPKPADIMEDVINFIGSPKQLQYWMLGAHICGNYSAVTPQQAALDLRTYLTQTTAQNVPFDSHCGTRPVIFTSECTPAADITQVNTAMTLIRNVRKKVVPHVTPYILHEQINPESSEEKNDTTAQVRSANNLCFDVQDYRDLMILKPQSTQVYHGLVDNKSVVYPSYKNISEEVMQTLWIYNTGIEGVILEDSWPLDESEKHVDEMHKHLTYFNKNFKRVFNNTPLWNAVLSDDSLYFHTHNLYSNRFAEAIQLVKGPIATWSSSQWFNLNLVVNRQNIPTSWTSLQQELIAAALGGISGHWLWSTPICGDMEDYDSDVHSSLCVKWYMAGTYMPMIKIHNNGLDRDPLNFTGNPRNFIVNSLHIRQSLLPYFYTVLQAGPLLRPMFFQYPDLGDMEEITSQFNVGDSLLIVPNLQPNQSHVHVRMLPGTWYEFWSGYRIVGDVGEIITMATTEADFLTLMRGGSIIPLQKDVRLTADETRLNSQYSLTIALHCETIDASLETTTETQHEATAASDPTTVTQNDVARDGSTTSGPTDDVTEYEDLTRTPCSASGHLYMSPNMTLTFEANNQKLRVTAVGVHFEVLCSTERLWANVIREINVYGLDADINNFDNYRRVTTNIDMCRLENEEYIDFNFVT